MTALRPAIDATKTPALAPEDAMAHSSFAQGYAEHFPFVWRSACRLGVDPSHVDDVVQETFVVVHRRLPEFEGRSTLKTWVFAIVANVVRTHRRTCRNKRLTPTDRAALIDSERVPDPAAGPDERATRTEAARLVAQLLDALDDDKRAVFVLAELEEMSAPDIAAALGVPLNTVYSRLRVAREEFGAAAARYRARDVWRIG